MASGNYEGLIKKSVVKAATPAKIENTIIGVGFGTSAKMGATMVAILAEILHIPKAVDTKSDGYNVALAK